MYISLSTYTYRATHDEKRLHNNHYIIGIIVIAEIMVDNNISNINKEADIEVWPSYVSVTGNIAEKAMRKPLSSSTEQKAFVQ